MVPFWGGGILHTYNSHHKSFFFISLVIQLTPQSLFMCRASRTPLSSGRSPPRRRSALLTLISCLWFLFFCFFLYKLHNIQLTPQAFFYLAYHTTHTKTAERRVEKHIFCAGPLGPSAIWTLTAKATLGFAYRDFVCMVPFFIFLSRISYNSHHNSRAQSRNKFFLCRAPRTPRPLNRSPDGNRAIRLRSWLQDTVKRKLVEPGETGRGGAKKIEKSAVFFSG